MEQTDNFSEELSEQNFFTPDEVNQLSALVNERLKGVIYHYWVNKAGTHVFEALDWITLAFESGTTLTLSSGKENEGIQLVVPDFEKERAQLEAEFKGKVSLESRDASRHKTWKNNLGKDITPSLLRHEGRVLNDSIVLRFEGGDDVEIFLSIEGMEVELFEE